MRSRQFFVIVFLLSTLLGMGNSSANEALPSDEPTQKARAAYNEGQFTTATTLFRKLTFKHPVNPGIYRALAASANNAKSFSIAVRAYRIYLELVPSGPNAEKARAELKNVERQLQASKKNSDDHQRLIKIERRFNDAVGAKNISGKNGAVALLKTLLDAGFFGPKYGEYHTQVLDGIEQQLEAVLSDLWLSTKTMKPESILNLEEVIKTAHLSHVNPTRLNRIAKTVNILASWNNQESRKALNQIQELGTNDYRLRYLQAHLLVQNKKFAEGEALFRSLAEQYHEPRLHLRAEQVRLARAKRISDDDLDGLTELLDNLPIE